VSCLVRAAHIRVAPVPVIDWAVVGAVGVVGHRSRGGREHHPCHSVLEPNAAPSTFSVPFTAGSRSWACTGPHPQGHHPTRMSPPTQPNTQGYRPRRELPSTFSVPFTAGSRSWACTRPPPTQPRPQGHRPKTMTPSHAVPTAGAQGNSGLSCPRLWTCAPKGGKRRRWGPRGLRLRLRSQLQVAACGR